MPDNAPPPAKGQMLPGVAAICLYMLVIALFGAVGVFQGRFGDRTGRFAVLAICSMVLVGVFGLLRMRRWGWALVAGGALVFSGMYAYMSHAIQNPGMLVMAGLDLCMFLYLIRTEVRDRLR